MLIGVDDPDAGDLQDAGEEVDAAEADGAPGQDVREVPDSDVGDGAVGLDAEPVDGAWDADAGPDPCAADGPTLRVIELLAMSSSVADGRTMGVLGVAEAGEITCDDAPCTTSCCQRCESGILVDKQLPLVGSECTATEPGCRGSECGVVCSPLLLGLEERFVGRVRFSSTTASIVLELLRVEQP